jgi:hypothetical protein
VSRDLLRHCCERHAADRASARSSILAPTREMGTERVFAQHTNIQEQDDADYYHHLK